MHKSFYASGFLYHPATAQILLQQQTPSNDDPTWSLLGGASRGKETCEESFKRLTKDFLKLNLPLASVHAVYEYFHSGLKKKNCVCYAEVDKPRDFTKNGKSVYAWFTLKEISKLCLSAQTKQDIIVGQRVIDSGVRKRAGERTIG